MNLSIVPLQCFSLNPILCGPSLGSVPAGSVANFAQEVLKGQLPPSVRGLSSQGVEQFGRSGTLVSRLDQPLPFLNHVHEFDTN